MISDAVQIDSGALAGITSADGRCRIFRGIPFAAPPVGELRWRAPHPVVPWRGVRPADRFGNACIQPLIAGDAFMRQYSFAEPPECGLSEDCLYLNVWTPAPHAAAHLPVIVWVFGGGHRFGSGSHPVSDGEGLARQGAIVVTINYRVGALGYLAHPALSAEAGASGNYASLDILAALQWVQRNIAAFGGDPECVTLFGQSAGAAHACVLMASALSHGLFDRVIAHSGGRFRGGAMGTLKPRASAEREGAELLEKLGARDLIAMRNLPADVMYGPRGFWNLILDGHVLSEPVSDTFARGAQRPVPVLCGFNSHEAAPYPTPDLHTLEGFRTQARAQFGEFADTVLKLYGVSDDASARIGSYALRRDGNFAYQAWQLARQNRSAGAAAFLYEFTRAPPLPAGQHFHEPKPPVGIGAYHGAELWYAFDNLDCQPWAWTGADRTLATRMCSSWAQFARSGDPKVDGLEEWAPYDDSKGAAMILDAEPRFGAPENLPALRFLDSFYKKA
ncbi:MAG: carboxylesterase family protein [Steroidobacteraceae bacterium]